VDLVKLDGRRARFEAVAPAVVEAVRRYLARRTDPATADDVLSETLLTRPAQPVIDAVKPSAVVVSLTGADGPPGKCAEPTAQILATGTDFAFAGTVTGIAGDVVTLSVTHVYKGARADEVRVGQAPGRSEEMLGSGRFETGKNYLIASSDGGVRTCGYSGEAESPGLQDLYDKAF
jgi:hypothetical protein